MSGYWTNGLSQLDSSELSADSRLPVDSQLGQGQAPQSGYVVPGQIVGAANGEAVALTDGATIALDAEDGQYFSVTLGGNRNLALSNMMAGQVVRLKVTQDGTGNRVITVTAGSGGATLVSGTPLSTGAAAVDLVEVMNIGTKAAPQYAYYPVAKNFV